MSQVRNRKNKPSNSVNANTVYHGDDDYEGDGRSFGVMDYVRMVLGLLLVNFVCSYYITGTMFWGNYTKWTNPRYIKFMATGPHYVDLTENELAQYDGSNPDLPIYVAINGSVYDVTSNPGMYGPGGAYSFFSGRDGARAFVTGCFKTDLTHDLRELDEQQAQDAITGWQNFYETSHKYWFVGKVNHGPLTGDPPAPCNIGKKAPKGMPGNK